MGLVWLLQPSSGVCLVLGHVQVATTYKVPWKDNSHLVPFAQLGEAASVHSLKYCWIALVSSRCWRACRMRDCSADQHCVFATSLHSKVHSRDRCRKCDCSSDLRLDTRQRPPEQLPLPPYCSPPVPLGAGYQKRLFRDFQVTSGLFPQTQGGILRVLIYLYTRLR